MLFCFENCSDLFWEKKNLSSGQEKLLLIAEGWEFAKVLRWLKHFIRLVKGQNNLVKQNTQVIFLVCYWRFPWNLILTYDTNRLLKCHLVGSNNWDVEIYKNKFEKFLFYRKKFLISLSSDRMKWWKCQNLPQCLCF